MPKRSRSLSAIAGSVSHLVASPTRAHARMREWHKPGGQQVGGGGPRQSAAGGPVRRLPASRVRAPDRGPRTPHSLAGRPPVEVAIGAIVDAFIPHCF
jgi:hypothetical protein